jgi:hypothetical protein
MNPRWIGHQGFPVKGLTRIITLRRVSASEMPESGAFRFGIEHHFLQFKVLISRLIFSPRLARRAIRADGCANMVQSTIAQMRECEEIAPF